MTLFLKIVVQFLLYEDERTQIYLERWKSKATFMSLSFLNEYFAKGPSNSRFVEKIPFISFGTSFASVEV